MPAIPYDFPIEVDPTDIDELGHVNNSVYLRWVQDAVVAHWRSVAPPEAVARHLWIATKHAIEYRRPAFLLDGVIATATLERLAGVRAFYRTVIRRGSEVLAEVESTWCCLDAVSRKPVKLGANIALRFIPSHDFAIALAQGNPDEGTLI